MKIPDTFSESSIDDDAVLVRSPPAEREAGGDSIAGTDPLSVVTDAGQKL